MVVRQLDNVVVACAAQLRREEFRTCQIDIAAHRLAIRDPCLTHKLADELRSLEKVDFLITLPLE